MTRHERHVEAAAKKAAKTPAEIEDERIRLRKRREWVARKVAHWTRMGTPSEINPRSGAAAPKHKIEADAANAKSLLKTCDRHCRRDHIKKAANA